MNLNLECVMVVLEVNGVILNKQIHIQDQILCSSMVCYVWFCCWCFIKFYAIGTVRVDDSLKYPIPRFGYPPLKRPQHQFSASYNDFSVTSGNGSTQSLDALTWSQNDAVSRRPSLARYSNNFQQTVKERFPFLTSNSNNKRATCKC